MGSLDAGPAVVCGAGPVGGGGLGGAANKPPRRGRARQGRHSVAGVAAPPAVPGPRNRTAAKWARKVANRQRAKAARRGWPDPWDDLRRESPQEPAADSPAPRAAGETELRGPPSPVDAPPGDEAPPPANLAAHIAQDAATFRNLGWRRFVEQRRTFSDFATLDRVDHPAQRLLKTYRARGAPVRLATEPWTPERVDAAL